LSFRRAVFVHRLQTRIAPSKNGSIYDECASGVTLGYDALGRRTTRTVNGTTTTYVYDGAQAIAEIKGGINATLLTGLVIDEVIGRYSGSGNRTMLTDALGSVIAEARGGAGNLNTAISGNSAT